MKVAVLGAVVRSEAALSKSFVVIYFIYLIGIRTISQRDCQDGYSKIPALDFVRVTSLSPILVHLPPAHPSAESLPYS